ncbi:MAG: LTA synthase family protein [Proteobacteria bacterium]|nr:LTA synthase family protein [Desulfobulbaceae bacterium]MBU4151519.1 LTA synthase family protein [Pseudomonadota bacterium]
MNPTPFIRHHSTQLIISLLLFVLLLPLIIHGLLWGWSAAGVISSLGSAALIALLTYRSPPLIIALTLVFWSIIQSVTVELVLAVGRMPSVTDAIYLVDRTMVQQSLQGNGLTHPAFLLAMLTGSLGLTGIRLLSRPTPRSLGFRNICLAVILLSPLHMITRQWDLAAPPWKQYDILHKLVVETTSKYIFNNQTTDIAWASVQARKLTSLDLQGTRLINQGKARNVLLIVLEGISGADIDQIREHQGYPSDQKPMPQLSALAQEYDAMHIPDFVVHNHQTIRGLYSLLCGDYPKLDFSTPKATELLTFKEIRTSCLPAQLANYGFSTHFLQAAELAFMSKDKVMPHIGFETTRGRESITPLPGEGDEITWGWDDKAFFSGSIQAIQQLQEQERPWFLTLLTVGTHQPYGAPQSYLERYPSPILAAIAFLDESASHFLTQLKEMGVFENTLVIITSDEARGNELRMGSAWGISMIIAPEHEELPAFKEGVYGHIDLAASVLDYFSLPMTPGISGRSMFRNYDQGREILSYTNGFNRHLNSAGNLEECNFQRVCREYDQGYRFNIPQAPELRRFSDTKAKKQFALVEALNRSVLQPDDEQNFLFANGDIRQLKPTVMNDWTDNLIGAQYLDFGKGTRTSVSLRITAVQTDNQGAALKLSLKEFDKDSSAQPPELPLLHTGEEMSINFDIDNPTGRRGFSFHLLGEGYGEIQIDEFRVNTRPITAPPAATNAPDATSSHAKKRT